MIIVGATACGHTRFLICEGKKRVTSQLCFVNMTAAPGRSRSPWRTRHLYSWMGLRVRRFPGLVSLERVPLFTGFWRVGRTNAWRPRLPLDGQARATSRLDTVPTAPWARFGRYFHAPYGNAKTRLRFYPLAAYPPAVGTNKTKIK